MPNRKTKTKPPAKPPAPTPAKTKPPLALVLNGQKVDELLSSAATAYAMNSVLTVTTAKDPGFWSNVKNFWCDGTPRSLTETTFDIQLYRSRRKQALKLYSKTFFKKMNEGSGAVLTYLRSKQLEIQLNRQAIAAKHRLANAVNDDVISQLNLSINATYGVQTVMGVLFVVVSGGAGLSFAGTLGAGVAYSVSCSVAKTVAEGKGAKIVALAMMPAMAMAKASGVASEALVKAFGKEVSDEFLEASKAAHEQAIKRMKRIQESGVRAARQGALSRAKANVAQTGKALRNTKAARVGVKGLSSAVGILFMLPEIETALRFDHARQQELPPSQRRKDVVGHAKRLVGSK